ncbi:sigma-70 family RNA polymerase sigma factor [Peribacillus frigoritolerans]|uniref:sigma-70 family RNA polymerase sigma factor n=1 Tax=Peribacillus frigoritolerans TaxID=450367 RepID=UPI00315C72DB
MKIYLATNQQLKAITKHDSDCSPSLLREVVEEMLNRNLFDRMISSCFQAVFGSVKRMTEVYKIDLEDFLQIGRTCVFEAIKSYKPGKGKAFSSFAYVAIKNKFCEFIRNLERAKRDQRNEFSWNDTVNGLDLIDIVINHINVEKYVINKITIEILLNKLTKRQRQIVDLFLQGYNFEETAEILGCKGKGRSLNKTYNDAIKKMRKGV